MLDLAIKVGAFIVAISLLVTVHEYGHFWVARRLGFKVERFSIGFGRALFRWWGKDADRVEYRIAAVPLGGYVKMLDERDAPEDSADLERAFNRRPVLHRIAVLSAGPGFNFLFAIVAFWAMFATGIPGMAPMVFGVTPDSPAARAGLRNNDMIVAVAGREVPTWEGASFAIIDEILADAVIDLRVRGEDNRTREISIDVRGMQNKLTEPDALFPELGVDPRPQVPAIVGQVTPEMPAAAAGVRPGDRILGIDGVAITDFNQLAEVVGARPDQAVRVRLERDRREMLLDLQIASAEENGSTVGRIGVGPISAWPEETIALLRSLQSEQKYGVFAALERGIARTWEISALTLRMITRMLTGDVSLKSMSGPITIADYAGQNAQAGFSPFLNFLAVVSISLGILNLMPVPILDGGQIIIQCVEWLKGSPLSERALAFGQQAGFLFFILLFSFVFYNDLTRVFS